MKIERDNKEQLAEKANEIFEGVEILEEDFVDRFDNHLENKIKAPELVSNKNQLLDLGEQCHRYDPCPICYKCIVKGSHLYNKCDKCPIPICVHTNKQKEMMIKRDNFKLQVGKALMDKLKELEQKHCSK